MSKNTMKENMLVLNRDEFVTVEYSLKYAFTEKSQNPLGLKTMQYV